MHVYGFKKLFWMKELTIIVIYFKKKEASIVIFWLSQASVKNKEISSKKTILQLIESSGFQNSTSVKNKKQLSIIMWQDKPSLYSLVVMVNGILDIGVEMGVSHVCLLLWIWCPFIADSKLCYGLSHRDSVFSLEMWFFSLRICS